MKTWIRRHAWQLWVFSGLLNVAGAVFDLFFSRHLSQPAITGFLLVHGILAVVGIAGGMLIYLEGGNSK